jgi:hypothetical protein
VPLPANGNKRGGPIGNTNFEKQRVVGYAPIRSDGSFAVEVPANRSLHMQTLDQYGMMLVNQLTWVQVMPGEHRLCTGCHDSHDRDKVINDLQITAGQQVFNKSRGTTYDAGFNNANNVLTHPSARLDTVDFFDRLRTSRSNTIQSVFDNRCVSCHGGASPAAGLTLQLQSTDMTANLTNTTTVYDTLTGVTRYRTKTNRLVNYVTQDGARQDPLMWIMYDRQLNNANNTDYRALSYDHSQLWTKDQYNRIDPFLPANRDLLTMIEWLDAGAQFSNAVSP